MYNISANDDDLFEETSTTETATSSPFSNQKFDSIINEVEKIFKDSQESVESSLVFSKFVDSFNGVTSTYVFARESQDRAVFDTLNELTNGKHQYIVYANSLEETISKRLIIIDFFRNFFYSTIDNEDIFKKILSKLGVDSNSRIYKAYSYALCSMLDYSIDSSIEIYIKVCEKIGKTPAETLVNKTLTDFSVDAFDFKTYVDTYYRSIRSELGYDLF